MAAATPIQATPPALLDRMDVYWRAANYLSVGQIYLRGNPLLHAPLALEHIKQMLLGHWGTTPEDMREIREWMWAATQRTRIASPGGSDDVNHVHFG